MLSNEFNAPDFDDESVFLFNVDRVSGNNLAINVMDDDNNPKTSEVSWWKVDEGGELVYTSLADVQKETHLSIAAISGEPALPEKDLKENNTVTVPTDLTGRLKSLTRRWSHALHHQEHTRELAVALNRMMPRPIV